MQLIRVKKDNEAVNLVILGAAGAPAVSFSLPSSPSFLSDNRNQVANELAAADIPVILAPFRSSPDNWEKLDALVGPPLTKSSAQVLSDAGVTFALAIGGMSTLALPTSLPSHANKYSSSQVTRTSTISPSKLAGLRSTPASLSAPPSISSPATLRPSLASASPRPGTLSCTRAIR
jgi:hypothetical protein